MLLAALVALFGGAYHVWVLAEEVRQAGGPERRQARLCDGPQVAAERVARISPAQVPTHIAPAGVAPCIRQAQALERL